MSAALNTVIGILKSTPTLVDFILKLVEWGKEGLSNDEIRRRLADPDHVGDDMLDRITARRERGRDLLGREPEE